MGWMSWERFRCITDCDKYPDDCISERLFMEMADVMVRDGYLAAGYEYVNIDDCWAEFERDESGRMVADKKRFPSGMKALADYVRNKKQSINSRITFCNTLQQHLDSFERIEVWFVWRLWYTDVCWISRIN